MNGAQQVVSLWYITVGDLGDYSETFLIWNSYRDLHAT